MAGSRSSKRTSTSGCTLSVATEVVGWVAGEPVLAADLDAYMASLGPRPVGLRLGVLDELASSVPGARVGTRSTAGLQDGQSAPGKQQGGPSPPVRAAESAVRAAESAGPFSKQAAVRTWAAKTLLADRLVTAEAARLGVGDVTSLSEWVRALEAAGEVSPRAPSEAEALNCYQANLYRYRVREARRARHLLVAERSLAEELAIEARSSVGTTFSAGTTFARLATQFSQDAGSRPRGGDLGWVERGQLPGPLEEAVFASPLGEPCGPVQSCFGWHLVLVEASRPERQRPFHECRQEILSELATDRRRSAFLEWWSRRLAEAVVVPGGSEHPRYPGLPGLAHRH